MRRVTTGCGVAIRSAVVGDRSERSHRIRAGQQLRSSSVSDDLQESDPASRPGATGCVCWEEASINSSRIPPPKASGPAANSRSGRRAKHQLSTSGLRPRNLTAFDPPAIATSHQGSRPKAHGHGYALVRLLIGPEPADGDPMPITLLIAPAVLPHSEGHRPTRSRYRSRFRSDPITIATIWSMVSESR